MLTEVLLFPYDIYNGARYFDLVVKYRVYTDGKFTKNGFWLFPMPVHEVDVFTRAYIEHKADVVSIQDNMFIEDKNGWFLPPNVDQS